MKTRRVKSFAGILAAAGLAFVLAFTAVPLLADTDSQVTDLDGTPIALTVAINYKDGSESTPVSGAGVSIYKVASLEVDKGNAIFTSTAEYADLGIVYEEITDASKSQAAAAKLAEATAGKMATATKVTNIDGVADFTDVSLDYGMYLVLQSSREGEACKYELFEPYLLMLPGVDAFTEEQGYVGIHEWQYKVDSQPAEEGYTPPYNVESEPKVILRRNSEIDLILNKIVDELPAKGEAENTTFSFHIIIKDENGTVVYDGHAGITFNAGDGTASSITIPGLPSGQGYTAVVEEEYSGNYEPNEKEITVTETSVVNGKEAWEFTFDNTKVRDTYTGGVVNVYEYDKEAGTTTYNANGHSSNS